MNTYISILRGINVGGQRMIKMDALRQLYASLGFENISTYIQSGNVIFLSKPEKVEVLAGVIAKKIAETFGFDVPTIVIEKADYQEMISKNPFLAEITKDPAHLHITFLSETPIQENVDKIAISQYLPDEFRMIGKVVYLYCPNSYSNSKLTNSFFESKLKVTATTRNWKTTQELMSIAEKN